MRWFTGFLLLSVGCEERTDIVNPIGDYFDKPDLDGDGYGEDVDCDDTNPDIHPDHEEICDGLDNDCDEEVDEGVTQIIYMDRDEDGYGDTDFYVESCELVDGYVSNGDDCDDANPAVFPGATEVCDGLDNDCNGSTDGDDPDLDMESAAYFYVDADGDGFGLEDSKVLACEGDEGMVAVAGDCDDSNELVHPDATEVCDGLDNDCDSLVDIDDDSISPFSGMYLYADADGDGFGDGFSGLYSCEEVAGYVENGDDCNDGNAAVHPDADEVCDTLDNDCDMLIDDADSSLDTTTLNTYYADSDGDGYGDPDSALNQCAHPFGYVFDNTDCNDEENYTFPNSAENDGIDCLSDRDGDGYAPLDQGGLDCDDTEVSININQTDVVGDGIDQNCDNVDGLDMDGDGVASQSSGGEDCDDSDPSIAGNCVPEVLSVAITGDPYTTEDFSCQVTAEDADGDSLSYTYRWLVAAIEIGSAAVLPAGSVAVGDALTCCAMASDGSNVSSELCSDVVTIENTAPTMDAVSLVPDIDVTNQQSISCVASWTEPDEAAPNLTYSWSQNGTSLGLTTETLDLSSLTVNPTDSIACEATITDTQGASDSGSASLTIVNTNPTISAMSISPSTVYADSELTCSASFADADGETPTASYQWTHDGNVLGSGETLQLDASLVGPADEVTCTIELTDAYGGSATQSSSVTVFNNDPSIDSLAITPATAQTNSLLTCAVSASDPNGDSPAVTYQWSNDTTGAALGTDATLQLSSVSSSPNDTISCTATATDAQGAAVSDSVTITLDNSAPTFTDAAAISSAAGVYTSSALTCAATAVDADDGALVPTYAWTVNGVEVATGSTYTVLASETEVGDTIECTATATDGNGASITSSDSAVIQNTEPYLSNLAISPISPVYNDSVLTCNAGVADPDEVLTASYEWSVGGTVLAAGSSINLADYPLQPSDDVHCVASVTDSQGASQSNDIFVTLDNRSPSVDTVTIDNQNPTTDSTLSCTATASDPDGESPSLSYEWLVDGTTVAAGPSLTLTAATAPVGSTVSCKATALDGYGESATDLASVTVDNTAPTISGTVITGGVYNTDVLSCSATAQDPDEVLSIDYTWSIGAVEIGTGASLDLAVTAALPQDVVQCTASVTDSGNLTASESATVTLLNRPPGAAQISISPAVPVGGQDDLLCNIDVGAPDDDGQSVSYTYEWTLDGVLTAYTSDTVPAADVGDDEVWVCTVIPDDGMDLGAAASATVTTDSECAFGGCDESLDLGNGVAVDFVVIQAGTFMMGSPTSEVGRGVDEDQHEVTLTNDFLVSTTEVTQGQFYELMGYEAYDGRNTSDSNGSFGVGTNYPAYHVSWEMAAAYSNALTNHDNSVNGGNLQECYACSGSGTAVSCTTAVQPIYQCTGYRMLTEAEWEYATRAGTTAGIWTSNGGSELPGSYNNSSFLLTNGFDLRTYAWYYATTNSPWGAKEVATLIPNDWGLFDMAGNVWEWTHDTYTASLGTGSTSDPVRENDFERVIRGGHWGHGPQSLRSARRYDNGDPANRSHLVGFRLARTHITQPTSPQISVSPAAPAEGIDDLSCIIDTESIDPDGNPVTYTFSWTVDGSAHNGSTATTTYPGDTIPAAETTGGETWVCTVTPNDGTEDGDAGTAQVSILLCDVDGDGDPAIECGGTDCDDNSVAVNGLDDDSDGLTSCDGDCDDINPAIQACFSAQDMAVTAPWSGSHHCAIGTDGEAECWGNPVIGTPPAGPFASLYSSHDTTCGIKVSQEVECWGSDADQIVSGAPAGSYATIATGMAHNCALNLNGEITCWGNDSTYNGWTGVVNDAPAGNFTQIAAGYGFTCAIGTNQKVTCWGTDNDGIVSNAPSGDYRRLSAGYHQICAQDLNDNIDCWGANFSGQSNPPSGSFTALASAYSADVCAIRSDQSIACWGSGADGMGSPPAGSFTSISAGHSHFCAINTSGGVECWGKASSIVGTPVTGNFLSIASNDNSTCGILDANEVVCWGDPSDGQTTTP